MDETLAAGEPSWRKPLPLLSQENQLQNPCGRGQCHRQPWPGVGSAVGCADPAGFGIAERDLGSAGALLNHRDEFFWDELRVSVLVATLLLMQRGFSTSQTLLSSQKKRHFLLLNL